MKNLPESAAFSEGMRRLRLAFRARQKTQNLVPPARPPRYDEVYLEGVAWLNGKTYETEAQ